MKIKTVLFSLINMCRLYMAGAICGKRIRAYYNIYMKISPHSHVVIGDNVRITSGGGLNPICGNRRGCIRVDSGAKLSIGNNVGMSSTVIWVKESVAIGDNTIIGGDSIIIDTDCHNIYYKLRRNKNGDYVSSQSAPIIIEDDVMIGARCIVLKGVTIGARSVIGAGSVVTQNIPADCIAAGNPCKVIKRINL